jgi:PleD family two-component response regulator
VGLAEHGPGEPLFSLMRRADLALYEAKREGKNRYAVAAHQAPAA